MPPFILKTRGQTVCALPPGRNSLAAHIGWHRRVLSMRSQPIASDQTVLIWSDTVLCSSVSLIFGFSYLRLLFSSVSLPAASVLRRLTCVPEDSVMWCWPVSRPTMLMRAVSRCCSLLSSVRPESTVCGSVAIGQYQWTRSVALMLGSFSSCGDRV